MSTAAIVADADLAEVLKTASGRRFMHRLIDEMGGFGRAVFGGQTVPEFEATHYAAFLDGKRSVALELVAECQRVDPSNYVLMLTEALDRRRAEEAARKSKESTDGGAGD